MKNFLHRGLVGLLLFHFGHFEHAQIHAFFGGALLAFLPEVLGGFAGNAGGHLRAEDAQHRLINLPLAAGEFAAHGNRPRQVAHVIAQAGRDIQQQQVALVAGLVVLVVMQNVVVGARRR